MTNPKSVAFYGSIFALRAPAHAPAWVDLSVVVLSVATPAAWYCTMALLASRPSVRRLLVRRKAALDTAAGLLLMAGVGGCWPDVDSRRTRPSRTLTGHTGPTPPVSGACVTGFTHLYDLFTCARASVR